MHFFSNKGNYMLKKDWVRNKKNGGLVFKNDEKLKV